MPNSPARPRLIGATVSVLLTIAALVLPGAALAAPFEGPGTVSASPEPIVLAPTTVGNQSPTQTVQISYEGEGEASVNKVTIEGGDAGEFFSNGSSCGNLLSGQSCEAWVGLKPTTIGEKQAFVVVTFNGERPSVAFPISGRSVAPQLAFTPSSYDFGLQRINRETTSTNFQMTNNGEAEVQLGSLEVSGPGQQGFWQGNNTCWGTWLAPGQSCSIQINFNPNQTGLYEAELRAWANGSVFTAGLEGKGGRAVVETPENPVGFGTAGVGSNGQTRAITLHNSGDLPESFFIGILAGGDAGSFHLIDENCTGAPLMPGGDCTAHVRFTPEAAGLKTAHLAFFGDGEGGVLVQVSGEGVLPIGSITPGSFDFGSQTADTRSAPHSFTIANPGTTRLDLHQVSIGGSELDQFVISSDECSGASLGPGEECLVRVRFAPDGSGAKQALLRVTSNAPTAVAQLSGTAIEASAAPESSSSPANTGAAPTASVSVVLPGPPPPPAPRRGKRHRRFVRAQDLPGGSQAARPAHQRADR
jgi:hypothetical protein